MNNIQNLKQIKYTISLAIMIRYFRYSIQNRTGMIIEIGEKLAAEKGDRGDIGYPGIYVYANSVGSHILY